MRRNSFIQPLSSSAYTAALGQVGGLDMLTARQVGDGAGQKGLSGAGPAVEEHILTDNFALLRDYAYKFLIEISIW